MDIAGALVVAGQAIGIVKDLREVERGLDSAEHKAKMAELYAALADVKMALADAQEELKAKDVEMDRLRVAFEFRKHLVEHDGFKYETFEDGTPKGDPFCLRCEQNNGRFYRLNKIRGNSIAWICPECKTDYGRVTNFFWRKPR